eukprot:12397258-Alexandrium_andersonii.AAC.1
MTAVNPDGGRKAIYPAGVRVADFSNAMTVAPSSGCKITKAKDMRTDISADAVRLMAMFDTSADSGACLKCELCCLPIADAEMGSSCP